MTAPIPVAEFLDEALPPAFSDETLALEFAELYGERLRYVAAWSKWYHWTGMHWQADDTLLAFDLARVVCRSAASACNNHKVAKLLASAKTVAAVERLARSDRSLAAEVGQWDRNIWLLEHTGRYNRSPLGKDGQSHFHDDYITRVTASSPGGACPIWCRFLSQVTDGDVELQSFLKRVLIFLRRDERACSLFSVRHRRQRKTHQRLIQLQEF